MLHDDDRSAERDATPGQPPPLAITGLEKAYGRVRAVSGFDLTLRPGELAGFIGPNGAGKSTTFRCIVGIQKPDAGEVRIGGTDIYTQRVAALRALGYVGQDVEVFRYLTGEEVLRMVGQLHELPEDVREARTDYLLRLLGLRDASTRLVREYSGGMAQKLAIAAAVLHEPRLILLDEAFAGLDPESTEAIRAHLDELRQRGAAVLLSSHILDTLERWVDRVVLLVGGRVVADLEGPALRDRIRDVGSLTALYLEGVASQRA